MIFVVKDTDDYRDLGLGFRFPSGQAVVEWDRSAWPPEQRLEHEHLSIYGSIADLEQGAQVAVRPIGAVPKEKYEIL